MIRLCAVLLLPLAACQSIETDIASSTAPEFADRRFEKICVSTPETDLLARRAIEESVAAKLAELGVESVQLGQLMFPGAEHSEEEVRQTVRECGADGFLTIAPLQAWTDTSYVPPATATSWSYGRRGHPYGWGCSTSWTSGGYTISRPSATFDVRLLDVATEEVAWMASIGAQGTGGTSWVELRSVAGREVTARLFADGMLEQGPGGER